MGAVDPYDAWVRSRMTSPPPKLGNYTKKNLCYLKNLTFYVFFCFFAQKIPKFLWFFFMGKNGSLVPLHGQERVIGKNGHWQERVIGKNGSLVPLHGQERVIGQ